MIDEAEAEVDNGNSGPVVPSNATPKKKVNCHYSNTWC